jgi:hypothetical protein
MGKGGRKPGFDRGGWHALSTDAKGVASGNAEPFPTRTLAGSKMWRGGSEARRRHTTPFASVLRACHPAACSLMETSVDVTSV